MNLMFLVVFYALGPLKSLSGCDKNNFTAAVNGFCEVIREIELVSAKHFNAGLKMLGVELCAAMTYYAAHWSNVLTQN